MSDQQQDQPLTKRDKLLKEFDKLVIVCGKIRTLLHNSEEVLGPGELWAITAGYHTCLYLFLDKVGSLPFHLSISKT